MFLAKLDDELQNRTGIRAAIDVVAQCNDLIVLTQFDEIYERRKRGNAAMNITDCEMPCHESHPYSLESLLTHVYEAHHANCNRWDASTLIHPYANRPRAGLHPAPHLREGPDY